MAALSVQYFVSGMDKLILLSLQYFSNLVRNPLLAETPPATIKLLTLYSLNALKVFFVNISTTRFWKEQARFSFSIWFPRCFSLCTKFITALFIPLKLKLNELSSNGIGKSYVSLPSKANLSTRGPPG